MIRPPKHWAPVPIETLEFDFSRAEARFGLPSVCSPFFTALPWGELPIFEVPALVTLARGVSVHDVSSPWGFELFAYSMGFCRRLNLEGSPPRLAEHLVFPDGVDFSHLLRSTLRVQLAPSIEAFFGALEMWLTHAAVFDTALIRASELDALTPEISKARLRAILRGERVPELCLKSSLTA